MAWLYLIFAGIFEMTGVTMINLFHKHKNIKTLIMLIAGFAASFFFLALAMETLSMGITYAVWTGIGASGAAILGMFFYQEPVDWKRILFILLIIGSTIGLKIVS